MQGRITHVKLGRLTQATSTDCLPAGVNQRKVNASPALLLASCSAAYSVFSTVKKPTSQGNGLKILLFVDSDTVNALSLRRGHTVNLQWIV